MMFTLWYFVKRNEMVRQESQVLCQDMPDSTGENMEHYGYAFPTWVPVDLNIFR